MSEKETVDQVVMKPTGFVAICRCKEIVGAMDLVRTPPKESGLILGRWLYRGFIVEPRFESSWECTIVPCKCKAT